MSGFWSADDIATLQRLYPDTSSAQIALTLQRTTGQIYRKAHALGLRKSERYLAIPDACRLRRGDNIGAAYRFRRGHVPANKGTRRPGWYAGRMRETQFKKGTINGRAAKQYKPIGHERLSKEGYLERKINNQLPRQRRWKQVHLLLWEQHYGPVPKGYAVGFIDGDRTHVVLHNLCLLSRQDLMRRNSYHRNYPKEIGLLIQANAQLTRQINKRRKKNEP